MVPVTALISVWLPHSSERTDGWEPLPRGIHCWAGLKCVLLKGGPCETLARVYNHREPG